MSELRDEIEIINDWKKDITKTEVSIICLTYNHGFFIETAIKSFLSQKTDFPFEIIIHDDASSDKTVEIIKNYAIKYPKIIKPILRTENQYSKYGFKFILDVYEKSNGKYISVCEGDDYFIMENKIALSQKAMEDNKKLSFLFSPAVLLNNDNGEISERNRYKTSDINNINLTWILKKGGGFYPTPTSFFKKSIIEDYPKWLGKHTTLDYPIAILAVLKGDIGYLNQLTACYRKNKGSVSNQIYSDKINAKVKIFSSYEKNIDFFNCIYKHQICSKNNYFYLLSKEKYMYAVKIMNQGFLTESIIVILKSNIKIIFKIRFLAKFGLKVMGGWLK